MKERDEKRIRSLVERRHVEGLIMALTERNMDVRRMAAKALGKIGDERAVEPLIAVLNDTTDYPVFEELFQVPSTPIDARVEAALALGKIGGRDAVEGLQAMADTGPEGHGGYRGLSVGEAVKKALAELGVIDRLNEGTIIDALRQGPLEIKPEEVDRVTALLISALKNPMARDNALRSLKKICTNLKDTTLRARLAKNLIELLSDNKNDNRLIAAEVLEQIGDINALEGLASSIGMDVSVKVQKACLKAMWRIDNEKTIQLLTKRIRGYDAKREETSVFKANWYGAAEALGQINETWVVEPLILILTDEDFFGSPSIEAAEALGRIGDKRAIQPLINGLKSELEYMRETVVESLKAITGQDFGEDFLAWQQWRKQDSGQKDSGNVSVSEQASDSPAHKLASDRSEVLHNRKVKPKKLWQFWK